MTDEKWTEVDRYFEGQLSAADPALDEALADSDAAGLPSISVSPAQGKLLFILAKAMGARRILELGTLGGYSGIWLARALPADGRLVTVEVDPASEDDRVRGTRRFIAALGADRRVAAAAIQTVGAKGYDGFAAMVVLES